jgi:hypothetical protein
MILKMNINIIIPLIGLTANFTSLYLFYKRTDGTELPLIQSLLITTNSLLLFDAMWNN